MLQNEEGIAYAQFDLNQCIEPKQFHDVVGYYNRFDIFRVGINRDGIAPVEWGSAGFMPSGPLAAPQVIEGTGGK